MALGKTVIKGGLAALMVMVMSAGAFAWEAAATTALNMRSGPGTQFRVVDVLQRGQTVDVEYCRSGWCFVDQGRYGPNGWASQRYLAEVGYRPPRPEPPRWERPRPRPPHWGNPRPRPPHWHHPRPRPPHWGGRPSRPDSQVCFNGPNGYFCIGN